MNVLSGFTKEELEILVEAIGRPINAVADIGRWYVWDAWREHGHGYGGLTWSSVSWSANPVGFGRDNREALRYLTVEGQWKC